MKSLKLLAAASVTSVVLAGTLSGTVYAWHPQVQITKYVTNVTANGQMADANDTASAVATKPGDTIKYTIVIENPANAADNQYNDLYLTKLTDELPAGVELVSDPAKRKITEDLGILKPGQKVTKEYTLKVTSTKDGDVVSNEACVTGNSKVNDAPRKDCDIAVIKVSVPKPPVTPEPPKTPETPKPQVSSAATTLPATGPSNVVAGAGAVTVLGYAANLLRLKRRASKRD
jgi:uncharacterized repeat protein (TIGR01451 family)